MSSFVTHAQNKDALAFKSLVEEKLAEKVVQVLEGLKIEVASNFFNGQQVSEEGGVSGGVSQVWKKPSPGGKGKASAPEPKLSAGPKQDRKDMKPGSGLCDEGGSPAVKEETQNSFSFEFQGLSQNLDEAVVLPGSKEHMAHAVHAMHVGDNSTYAGNHLETKYYHIHAAGHTPYNPNTKPVTHHKSIYVVHHKYHMAQTMGGLDQNPRTHKFHVSHNNKTGGVHVEHMGSLNNEEYMAEKGPIGPVKKGQMHKDLGKSPDAKITGKDIAKEKAKGGVFTKRATFAQNAKKWHHEETEIDEGKKSSWDDDDGASNRDKEAEKERQSFKHTRNIKAPGQKLVFTGAGWKYVKSKKWHHEETEIDEGMKIQDPHNASKI